MKWKRKTIVICTIVAAYNSKLSNSMVSLKYIKKKENRDQNQNLNKTKENCDTNVAAEEKYNNKLSNSMMGLSREKYRTERKLKRLKEK